MLGRPWQFDREVAHDFRIHQFKFWHYGRKIVLKPLLPDEVYGDLKQMEENRNEGKSVQAQLWVQRRVGFSFMSFRKLQKEDFLPEPTAQNVPCSISAKQSVAFRSLANDEGGQPESDTARNESLEVGGTTMNRGKAPNPVEDDRLPPSTRLPQISHVPAEQSKRENQWDGLTSNYSNFATIAKTLAPTPETLEEASLDWNAPGFDDPIVKKTPLFFTKSEDKDPLLDGAIQLDLRKSNVVESSHEVRGMIKSIQFVPTKYESKTPNFQLRFLGFEILNVADGGNVKLIDLTMMVMTRAMGRFQNYNWKPENRVE
ncbi:unnamed protein product [Linum trigynum]|uniref:Uncharacterized protein n=1 Tax=Linum trigynum TaxID=586398 RepID=A0AAV2CEI7_9ROSI